MDYDYEIEAAEAAEPEGDQTEPIQFDGDHYLRLSINKIAFEGGSKSGLTTVCFDESNVQVFSILSGDVTEVTVKSPYKHKCHNFKMEEKGRVIAIKFSPDQKILALQRSQSTVEFLTLSDGRVARHFQEMFKNCKLLGFVWSNKTDVIFITNLAIKLCRVDMLSGSAQEIKSLNLNPVNWYNFYSDICLLLVSVGQTGNSLQLLQVKHNQILKISKFEVELDTKYRGGFNDRDIFLGVVYNQPRILIMNHPTSLDGVQSEVVIYTIKKLSEVKKSHILRIHQTGRFAFNIVDNLIVVHNQVTSTSMVFDITEESHVDVKYHFPVVEPKSLKCFDEPVSSKIVELYSKNWIMFQPDIVMDVKIGYLWVLELNLPGFCETVEDKKALIKFLLSRSGSKLMITRAIYSIARQPSQLGMLGEIFDLINRNYCCYLQQFIKRQQSLPLSSTQPDDDVMDDFQCVIDQAFMHNQVFCKLAEQLALRDDVQGHKTLSWVLLEYIRSLADLQIPAQHFVYELLIKSMVVTKHFFQLHQLLQHLCVNDSKALACLLLSHENLYSASPQLALDMLERLGTGTDEIIEILLAKKQVISCLRYMEKKQSPQVPSKFLEAASQTGKKGIFHAVKMHLNPNAIANERRNDL